MATFTVGDLLDTARDFHPSFMHQDITDKMLMRQLSSSLRHLYTKVTETNENALVEMVSLTSAEITAALTAGYYAMPSEAIRLIEADARVTDGDMRVPVWIYAAVHRFDPTHFPSIYQMGQGKVRLTSETEMVGISSNGWQNYQDLRIWYVPSPANVTTMTATITVPDIVQDALVADLVVFMTGRSPKDVQAAMDLQLQRISDRMASAIAAIADQNNSEHGFVQMSVPF